MRLVKLLTRLCSKMYFSGTCTYLHLHDGQRHRFPDQFDERLRSFVPDPKGFCRVRLNTDCSGTAVQAKYDGGKGK
jgi:hypothetical protein